MEEEVADADDDEARDVTEIVADKGADEDRAVDEEVEPVEELDTELVLSLLLMA